MFVGRCRDHGLDHEAGLGHAAGNRRRPHGRDRDADADAKMFGILRVALVLVDDDVKPRGLVSPSMPRIAATPRNGRQHHGEAEGQFLRGLDAAVLVDFFHRHHAGLDLLDAAAGHPLDVVVAHFALEQALGVAHAIESEVADVGFGGDEGHRHAVADLAAAQFGFDDEHELIGRAEARSPLHRADDDRCRVLAEVLEGLAGDLWHARHGRRTACGLAVPVLRSRRRQAPVRLQ